MDIFAYNLGKCQNRGPIVFNGYVIYNTNDNENFILLLFFFLLLLLVSSLAAGNESLQEFSKSMSYQIGWSIQRQRADPCDLTTLLWLM